MRYKSLVTVFAFACSLFGYAFLSLNSDTDLASGTANMADSHATSAVRECARVVRVVDGDTVEIEGGEKLRYIGIDTPETVDPRKTVQCFGKEASAKNTELVLDKEVCLEKDITDRDKYGRLLRYVFIGDKMVNKILVEEGYARSYSYPPDISHQNEFVEAEKNARENNRGLWGGCGSVSAMQETQSPANGKKENGCDIKGNISSNGKIYHMPGCGSYEKTTINESQGEKWFCSEAEAVSAGWRKAGNCD